jgi:hypothetical protein
VVELLEVALDRVPAAQWPPSPEPLDPVPLEPVPVPELWPEPEEVPVPCVPAVELLVGGGVVTFWTVVNVPLTRPPLDPAAPGLPGVAEELVPVEEVVP